MDVSTFRFFSKEAQKLASGEGRATKGILKGVKTRDLAAAGLGAAALYGGSRLYNDIKAGEQLRKQQRGY